MRSHGLIDASGNPVVTYVIFDHGTWGRTGPSAFVRMREWVLRDRCVQKAADFTPAGAVFQTNVQQSIRAVLEKLANLHVVLGISAHQVIAVGSFIGAVDKISANPTLVSLDVGSEAPQPRCVITPRCQDEFCRRIGLCHFSKYKRPWPIFMCIKFPGCLNDLLDVTFMPAESQFRGAIPVPTSHPVAEDVQRIFDRSGAGLVPADTEDFIFRAPGESPHSVLSALFHTSINCRSTEIRGPAEFGSF